MALSAAAYQGIAAPDIRVFYHYQGGQAGRFVADALSKNVQEPSVIAGHSLGGDSAYNLANALGKRGIEVESMGLFDEGTLENVKRRYNFSTHGQTGLDIFHGAGFIKGAGQNNFNLSGLVHTNIDQTPLVQRTVTREIVEAHRAATQKACMTSLQTR